MTSPFALEAPAADPTSTAAQYTSVSPALYRAALGPVDQEHYLGAFERLDATGRVLPGWNLAAALCPLGWLAFRRLWRQAVLAAVALLAGGLLLWVAGHQWLALPLPMLAGLALAGLTMVCAAAGLYGDALVYADVRRRIDAAVSAAPTLREAMGLLQRQASSRRRLLWVAAVGAALVLVALVVWLSIAGARGAAQVVDAGKPAPVVLPEPESAVQPPGAGTQLPVVASADPSTEAIDSPLADGESAPAEPEPEPPEVVAQPAQALLPTLLPDKVQAQAQAQAKDPVPARERRPDKVVPRRLYVNAGLFADPENARRTHARLRQAGLPCSVEPLARADGRRLQRVRVGPFGSAAQANAAAARVRAMGLEAGAATQ